jgi:hypothetical protein
MSPLEAMQKYRVSASISGDEGHAELLDMKVHPTHDLGIEMNSRSN